MSKNFFGSFEHGGWFKINNDLYINMPDNCEYEEDNTLVYVGFIHKYGTKFCEVPNLKSGEEVCRWVIFELLPMYEEWKIKGGRTPWEMQNKTRKEETIYSLIFPHYPFPDANLHLRVIDGKIMTMIDNKVIEELPKHVENGWDLDRYFKSLIENECSDKAIKCCRCQQLYPLKEVKLYRTMREKEWTEFQDEPFYSHYYKRFITLNPELPKAPRKDMMGGFVYKEVEEYICHQCLEEEQTQWEKL